MGELGLLVLLAFLANCICEHRLEGDWFALGRGLLDLLGNGLQTTEGHGLHTVCFYVECYVGYPWPPHRHVLQGRFSFGLG